MTTASINLNIMSVPRTWWSTHLHFVEQVAEHDAFSAHAVDSPSNVGIVVRRGVALRNYSSQLHLDLVQLPLDDELGGQDGIAAAKRVVALVVQEEPVVLPQRRQL